MATYKTKTNEAIRSDPNASIIANDVDDEAAHGRRRSKTKREIIEFTRSK